MEGCPSPPLHLVKPPQVEGDFGATEHGKKTIPMEVVVGVRVSAWDVRCSSAIHDAAFIGAASFWGTGGA